MFFRDDRVVEMSLGTSEIRPVPHPSTRGAQP